MLRKRTQRKPITKHAPMACVHLYMPKSWGLASYRRGKHNRSVTAWYVHHFWPPNGWLQSECHPKRLGLGPTQARGAED